MNDSELDSLLASLISSEAIILVVLSSPLAKQSPSKVSIRPLQLKGQLYYQKTEQIGPQALHHNLDGAHCLNYLREHLRQYKQTWLYTKAADYHVLVDKQGLPKLLKKSPTKSPLSLHHNRQKNYILAEGQPIPFLVQLGVMNKAGKVYPQKMDKFRQINRFLELIDDVVVHLGTQEKTVNIVDFGCGKAYLTFALHYFLKVLKGYSVKIVGLDLKQEVIETCQQLTQLLGYGEELRFERGDINGYETPEKVDMMVSLHACDTATDAALEKAVLWGTKVILSVPCCQHELFEQVQNPALTPLLKHGILKERFAALATDAARAQLLQLMGYEAQIIEFIDLEHTPKNLLIRAIKRPKQQSPTQALQEYLQFKQLLGITPSLEKVIVDRGISDFS